ncbi:MAG: hypothetical protein MI865_13560, partial [Proteobacteria bacterium]|nr:hypothetical protein [Pseudomonadota bacterium]
MLPETKAMVWPRIYILPTIFAIASCYQIIFIDYPYGHDWIFELVRLNEYYDSIKSGQILPYWSNNLYFGFGSPIFIYYAPLYNIVSSVVIVIGSSLKTSAVISLILFMMIAAIGMAGLLWESNKNNTKPEILMACRIGAIAYVLSPYILSNLLIRNASAELAALCLAPYPFWGLVMLYNNKKKGIIFLAIGTALSILSHNLTALTITALLLTGSIILFLYYRDLGKLYYSIFSVITGIAITTWFWLPALYLKSEVRIHEMTAGKFAFENNFLSLTNMIGFDQFYSFGFFPILVLILSLLTLIISKPRSKLVLYIFICSMLFLFLQSDLSYILWNNLIFLELFQFPWRMMGPFSFCMAVLLGICLSRIKLKPYITELIFIIFIIINCLPVL